MIFLNALLLGGVAAGGIPLAVHLLQRKNKRVIFWGAMQFLELQTRTQKRRAQIEQWLLLLVRVCIPVLLALCMARPFLSGLSASSNRTPESLVVLLDDSVSMSCSQKEPSPFTTAKSAAEYLMRKLPNGSEVSVISLTAPTLPAVDLTANTPLAIEHLKKLASAPTAAQLGEGLETCISVLAKSHNARRRVVILSDFQRSNWSITSLKLCEQPLERMRMQNPKPEISLYDAGGSWTENSSIESLAFTKLPVGIGETVHFTATLKNYGSNPQVKKSLQWKINGNLAASKTVSIDAHSSTQASLDHVFKESGNHTIEVQLEPDTMPADDTLYASVNVREPMSVLIVNGRTSQDPIQSESVFLETALQPATAEGIKRMGIINPVTIEPSALNAKILARQHGVILADVRTLTKPQVQDLLSFSRNGGGLLLFPGNQADVDWMNNTLYADGSGILPARFETVQTSQPGSMGITKTFQSHPVLEPFASLDGAFDEIKIQKWFLLKIPERGPDQKNVSPANVILHLENGHPLFVEGNFGAGVVIQGAIPCGPSWSNLPARPAYVPLVQRLVLHACTSAEPPLNLSVHQPITVTTSGKVTNQLVTFSAPDGTTTQSLPHKQGERSTTEFFGTQQPGFYRVSTGANESKTYAVNASRDESDPERLGREALEKVARQMDASIARTPEELTEFEHATKSGREVWPELLGLVLLLLFTEIILCKPFNIPTESGS